VDKYEVLLIVGVAIFIMFCLVISLRRLKKFKGFFNYHYEKLITEIRKSKPPEDLSDSEPQDRSSPGK
jgi:hypothetical protein